MTAGIYASRQKLDTLMISKTLGGQMARKAINVENYPGFNEISGLDLCKKFDQHLKTFGGIETKTESVVSVSKADETFSVLTGKAKTYFSKTVIIASGADPRPLEAKGEKEFIGKGVSYCVACDGPLFSKKTVAVVGGGNCAFEAAISLSNYAKKIYVLERGSEIRADRANQERAERSGIIEVILNTEIEKIQGEKTVSSVVVKNRISGKTRELSVEGVFVEIGSQPASLFVKDLVDFNEKDEIIVDPKTCQTKTPGLFAAGDVNNLLYKQIVVAAGEGAAAALSVLRYLQTLE